MGNFVLLLKKNLLEMARNKRIIIFSVVFVIVSVISALTAKFLPELFKLLLDGLAEDGSGLYIEKASVADSYVQYIANMGEIAVLLVGVMFASTITKEKSTGTYEMLKMNGVKDSEIVLSHFVAQVILVTISYILSVAAFVLFNILLFSQIMGIRGLLALTYIYILLLVTISFTLFSSCLCKKSGKAYLMVILVYFGALLLVAIPKINKINPFNLLTISNNLMYQQNYSLSDGLFTVVSSLLMIIVFVIVSLFIVKNRINNRKETINEDITK